MKSKGEFIVGKIKDFDHLGGWFFGQFMEKKGQPLLASQRVEVAWKKFPKFSGKDKARHLHKKGIEINIIVKGWTRVKINDREYKIKKGGFFVVHPYATVEDVEVEPNTEMIVIKTPSLANDKFNV